MDAQQPKPKKQFKIFSFTIEESLCEKITSILNGSLFLLFLTLGNTFLINSYLGD